LKALAVYKPDEENKRGLNLNLIEAHSFGPRLLSYSNISLLVPNSPLKLHYSCVLCVVVQLDRF